MDVLMREAKNYAAGNKVDIDALQPEFVKCWVVKELSVEMDHLEESTDYIEELCQLATHLGVKDGGLVSVVNSYIETRDVDILKSDELDMASRYCCCRFNLIQLLISPFAPKDLTGRAIEKFMAMMATHPTTSCNKL